MSQSYEISSVNWTPYGSEYFNVNRELSSTNTEEGDQNHFILSNCLTGIEDISINHDTIFYLTSTKKYNDLFTSYSSITSFNLSSLPLSTSSFQLGNSASSSFVNYYYCANTPILNKSLDIREQFKDVENNHVLYSPFKYYSREDNDISYFQFNQFSLKNTLTPYYDYDQCNNDINHRNYKKIYTGSNQSYGFNNIFLSYTASLDKLTFQPNVITYFHYPYDSDQMFLSASCLISRGAKAGDVPMNSDIISMDRYGYDLFNSSGSVSSNYNGTFLCSWLSSDGDSCGCNSVWMERWYDPNNVTQGDAYITQVSTSSSTSIWDISSSMEFIPKVRYYYDRLGTDRNTIYVNSLSTDLKLFYDTWTEVLEDSSENDNDGFIKNYDGDSEVFELSGDVFAYIPITDSLLETSDEITTSISVYKDKWDCGVNSQLIGNYNNGGWGLFYNTGFNNSIITIGDIDGFIYSFNSEGTRIFEKSINNDSYLNVEIDQVMTDLNGDRWFLDKFNNKVYKLNSNDILSEVINFPVSHTIEKIQISSTNDIYILDTFNDKIYIHDNNGVYLSSTSVPSTATNFELDNTDAIHYSTGHLMSTDEDNNVYKAFGSNLYKNDKILYHFSEKISDFKLDSNGNIWLIYSGNYLVKLTTDGVLLFEKQITDFLSEETSPRLGLVKEKGASGCDIDRIWIVFEDKSYILKCNTSGDILNVIKPSDIILSKTCKNYKLKANGDFTGFDIQRKFNINSEGVISSENPSISLKLRLKDNCGSQQYIIKHIPSKNLQKGWHTISFTFNSRKGKVKFYLDSTLFSESNVTNNLYKIDYDSKSPLIIGGNSGKIGSSNEELALDIGYFIGKIKNVRIYNKELGANTIASLHLFNNEEDFEPLLWNIEVDSKNYVEKIDRFFMMKKPGHSSKYFNLKIKGLSALDSDLKLLIEDSIKSTIDNIIPAHVELNEIIFS